MRSCLARKGGLLPETALTRHRTIGGHASCPRIALRPRQFLVRRLPTGRWMRHLGLGGAFGKPLASEAGSGSAEQRKENPDHGCEDALTA